MGPLPPGEYAFAAGGEYRASFGPRTAAAMWPAFSDQALEQGAVHAASTSPPSRRGNIAIRSGFKGEMSEACIGLEPKAGPTWRRSIKEGRATPLNAFIDEPYPQVAEAPPIVVASGVLADLTVQVEAAGRRQSEVGRGRVAP